MWIYTFNEEIKDKLLNNKVVLNKQREINGRIVYLFKINNISILNKFSKEENLEIYPCSKKMFF